MNDGMYAPASLLRDVRGVARAELTTLADQRRPIVVVLGMHRSGTSLCSNVLSALGVEMTDRVLGPGHEVPAHDNLAGHWERWEIVEFHDRILACFDQLYTTITHDFPLPVAWWADPRVVKVRREIATFLNTRMESGVFGFKDPRTVRLMPIWHQIFAELKLAPKIIFCLRNPAQVARSINVRDGFRLDLAEYRWLSYNIDFFRYTREIEFCTIEYESWFEDSGKNLQKLRAFLRLPAYQNESDLDLDISQIIRRELRHDDLSRDEASQPLVRSVYSVARRAEQDPAARGRLQAIAAEFRCFQQLQRAFQHDLQHNTAQAARLAEIEQDAAILRAQLGERDARVAAMEAERIALGEALATAKRDFDESRQSLEAELAVHVRRVGELETELAKHINASEQLNRTRGELSALNQAVAESDKRNAGQAARLAEMEQEADESRQALDVLQHSLDSLRRELSRLSKVEARATETNRMAEFAQRMAEAAQRKAGEAEHYVAALTDRIAALTAELANARHVARAAVQALRSGAGTVHREPRLGWRQTVRCLFDIAANP